MRQREVIRLSLW